MKHVLSSCGPYHITLFYGTEHAEGYEDLSDDHLQDNVWEIASTGIYVVLQGVAALVELTAEQMVWYRMQDESVPHVSLALHAGHQASDLGPMVRLAVNSIDWVLTQIPNVSYSPSCKTYQIDLEAVDTVLLECKHISRAHGREKVFARLSLVSGLH